MSNQRAEGDLRNVDVLQQEAKHKIKDSAYANPLEERGKDLTNAITTILPTLATSADFVIDTTKPPSEKWIQYFIHKRILSNIPTLSSP